MMVSKLEDEIFGLFEELNKKSKDGDSGAFSTRKEILGVTERLHRRLNQALGYYPHKDRAEDEDTDGED